METREYGRVPRCTANTGTVGCEAVCEMGRWKGVERFEQLRGLYGGDARVLGHIKSDSLIRS